MTHTLDNFTSSAAPVEKPNEETFDRVLELVAQRRDEFEEKRHVPRDMIAEFKKAGIYRAGCTTKVRR